MKKTKSTNGTATVVFKHKRNGDVDVQFKFDPSCSRNNATPAQQMAFEVLDFLRGEYRSEVTQASFADGSGFEVK